MLFKKIALLSFVMLLSACKQTDFKLTPLYAGNIVNERLSSVYVATNRGEYGVYLHNLLNNKIITSNKIKYRLNTSFTVSETDLAIGRDNSAARKQVLTVITFTLIYIDGSERKDVKYTTAGTANYSSSSSPYVTEVSQQDAIRRALRIAGETGVLRLSVMFKQGKIK